MVPRVVDEDVDEQSRWTDEGIDCDTTLASSLVTDEMSTAQSVDIDNVDVTLLNQRKRRQRSPMVIERPKISKSRFVREDIWCCRTTQEGRADARATSLDTATYTASSAPHRAETDLRDSVRERCERYARLRVHLQCCALCSRETGRCDAAGDS